MKMLSEMKNHFQSLVDNRAVYVWGGNGEQITPEMIERLYRSYHSAKYTRAYYNGKLAEGRGRIGADCSGAFFPVSGYDTTAHGYYTRCKEKGMIGSLPRSTPCMVFIKQGGRMVHIGWYDGTGKVYEMRSSAMNVRHDALGTRWTHWGKPDFVEYPVKDERGEPAVKSLQAALNAAYKSGLAVDGILGKKTTAAIKAHLLRYRKGSPLKAGAFVKWAQERLIQKGYSCGGSGADGEYGKNTAAAVRKMQADAKIDADGIVGIDTVKALLM